MRQAPTVPSEASGLCGLGELGVERAQLLWSDRRTEALPVTLLLHLAEGETGKRVLQTRHHPDASGHRTPPSPRCRSLWVRLLHRICFRGPGRGLTCACSGRADRPAPRVLPETFPGRSHGTRLPAACLISWASGQARALDESTRRGARATHPPGGRAVGAPLFSLLCEGRASPGGDPFPAAAPLSENTQAFVTAERPRSSRLPVSASAR